jgi:DNA-binding NarL/FixJ family response regulator
MAKNGLQNGTAIGLVAKKGSLATRIRGIVTERGFSLAFEIPPERVEDRHAVREADLVIVAVPLEIRDGSLLSRLRLRLPEAPIVACSEPVESRTIRWAMDRGVHGVIWNSRLEESLELTLRTVHVGQVVIPREVLRDASPPELTNREKQALSMVIMGLTNLEIAQKLFISENTVKSHLNTAYKKLGVHSRAEAQRLITDPDQGLGTGILAITAPGLSRGRPPKKARE